MKLFNWMGLHLHINDMSIKHLSFHKGKWIICVFLLVLILITGMSIVDNYGISWDEVYQSEYTWRNIRLIRTGEPLGTPISNKGLLFELTNDSLWVFCNWLKGAFSIDPHKGIFESIQRFLQKGQDLPPAISDHFPLQDKGYFFFKHKVTFIFSLIAYIGVIATAAVFTGRKWAWMGIIILALFPRYWGHSFFNMKDIPFAALYSLSGFLTIFLVNKFLKDGFDTGIGRNKLSLLSFSYGVLLGLTSSIRLGGMIFLPIFIITLLSILIFDKRRSLGKIIYVSLMHFLLILTACSLIILLLHPSSWNDPISWFIRSIKELSYYTDYPLGVRYFYENLSAGKLPWHYLPVWFLITTPIPTIALAATGFIIYVFRFNQIPKRMKISFVILVLQIVSLPIIAIMKGSIIYDGIRHFLFIVPGIVVLASIGACEMFRILKATQLKIVFSVALIVAYSNVLFDMGSLHPYEYVYFNQFVRDKDLGEKFETDYWALSFREATEWVNKNKKTNDSGKSMILVCGPDGLYYASALFAETSFVASCNNLSESDIFYYKGIKMPFYYIGLNRFNHNQKYLNCKKVHVIERQLSQSKLPLAVIRYCE